MIFEARKSIDELLSEIPDDKDVFVLGLSRFVLHKNKYCVDTDLFEFIAVSDSLEELKTYMADNNLKSYVEIDGNIVKKRYYYYYEIFRNYGNDKRLGEHIESFYDKLYYDRMFDYYKEEELSEAISWRIEHDRECFILDDWRDMDMSEDTITIFNCLTDEVIETFKIEDIGKRKDLIEEITRNNFILVE